jgi:uracil phosphoribosyltransferase
MLSERELILLDPMLATGGSATMAARFLKGKRGCKYKTDACLIAAPEGIKAMQEKHPDIEVYTASVDERLNSHGYIIPGARDAGDRLFGTK